MWYYVVMNNYNKLLNVSETARLLKVSEETIRRWIRSKSLRAVREGREFLISLWDLESFIITGGKPLYENSDLLLMSGLGFEPARIGSFLFDEAYFKLEKQWQRINEDNTQMIEGVKRQAIEGQKEWKTTQEWLNKIKEPHNFTIKSINERPKFEVKNYWSLPLRTLFTDIHFYFVAAEAVRKSVIDRLEKDIGENEFTLLVNNYRPKLNKFKVIRGMLEHIDKQVVSPDIGGDLGNLDNKGFTFGKKHYEFYIDDIRKLRNNLCDYFLFKTLPEPKG